MSETPLEVLKRYEALIQEGLQPGPHHWFEIADASYALGLWSQAVRAYTNLLREPRYADEPTLRFKLGVALTFAESPERALEHLTYAVERHERPCHLKGLADALAVLGESSLAREVYLRCVEVGSSPSELTRYDVVACIEALHQCVSALDPERLSVTQAMLERWRATLERQSVGCARGASNDMLNDTLSLAHYVEALLYKRAGDHERSLDAYLEGARLKRASTPPDWGALLKLNRSIKGAYDAPPATRRAERSDERIAGSPSSPRGQAHHAQDESPIFILGMPRSGTSLTAQILSRHTATVSLGERGVLYEALRGWSRVSGVETLRAPQLEDVAIANRSWWTEFDDSAEGTATRCVELMSAHAQMSSKRAQMRDQVRYIEKTPSHHLFAGWIHEVFPRAKIIHCRRDPISTCYSCFTHHFSSGHEWSYDLEDVALYYLAYDEMMRFWSSRGVEMHELSLEALTAEPEREIKALLEFCELPWESACLSPEQSDALVYTSSLHQVREPIRARPEAWRRVEHRLEPLISLLNLSDHERALLFT